MADPQFPIVSDELEQAEKDLMAARKKVDQLRRQVEQQPVDNYELKDSDGNAVKLFDLFGEKSDMIVIHNMGKSCSYCTMWADGLLGVHPHLSDQAAFAFVSYDQPEVAAEFSQGRNWDFPVYSNAGSSFFKDMGFESDKGDPWPGVSTFHRNSDGKVTRVSYAYFGPGDDFCNVWHFIDMLKDGADGWSPKYKY